MFEQHNSLSSRLGNTQAAPKIDSLAAHRALQEAHGERGFSIKGASSGKGNVVEVSGLAEGTTAEDVEVRLRGLRLLNFLTPFSLGHLQAMRSHCRPQAREQKSRCRPHCIQARERRAKCCHKVQWPAC